jgi:serine/threonine protein kinase
MESEEEYVSRQLGNEELPLRWCAPEVMIRHQHSAASDVWALGVLLWEIYSNAKTPYGALNMAELVVELDRGYRLPQPTACDDGRPGDCSAKGRDSRTNVGRVGIKKNRL